MAYQTIKSVCKLSRSIQVLTLTVAVLYGCLSAFSQAGTSSIRGGITDQTGGVVEGATVTVLDPARGLNRVLTTDVGGQYLAPNVIPGTYTVRAEFAGFRTIERSGVLVEVGQNVRIDLVLQPGEQTQTITVTEDVPFINTSDAQLGRNLDNQAINELPINGRNYYRLLQLNPGVVTTVGSGTGNFQYTNGRKNGDDLFRYEGIAQIAQTAGLSGILNGAYRSGDSSSLLPLDAVTEFSTTTMPKAEDGWKEGATISIGIKSGTNALHGTAYAFGRHAQATDARNYFDTTGEATPAELEQFGATAGGPIVRDKLFWFVGYEGMRMTLQGVNNLTIPASTSLLGSLPAATARTLSMVDACNFIKTQAAPNNVINPLSASISGLDIPTCTVTPRSDTVNNLFPFNDSGDTLFHPGLTSKGPLNNGVAKGDYAPSPNHHLSGSFFRSRNTSIFNTDIGQIRPEWRNEVINRVDAYTAGWTWIVNSNVVNDLRWGLAYFKNQTALLDADKNPADPWPSGYGMNTGVTNPDYFGLPTITITGFTGMLGVGTNGPTIRGPEGNWSIIDTVSYLRGKHAFKFGFEFINILFEQGLGGNIRTSTAGQIPFASLQDFLRGNIDTAGRILVGDNTSQFRSHWYAGFAQDDWRITPRVTLNLGMRWEFKGPPTERNNYFGNFNPNVNPLTTPAVQRVGPGAPLRHQYEPIYNEWSPRVGVAWDVQGNGKTVVRASGMLLRDYVPLGSTIKATPWGASYPTLGINTSGTVENAKTPADLRVAKATMNWSLAGPIFPISNTGLTCSVASKCTITSAMDPNFKHPRAAEWSFDVQRAITANLGIDVAYVGNYGYKESFTAQLNMPAFAAGWTPAKINACIASGPTYAGTACTPDATAEVGQYTNIFPYLNFISQFRAASSSNYNALQVTGNMRNYHGLNFRTAYTWAHSLGNSPVGSPYNPDDLSLYYSSSPGDHRNRFSFSPTYEIPGMKSPLQMLEGWEVNAVVLMQGGLAWGPNDATNDMVGIGSPRNIPSAQFWNFSGPTSDFRIGKDPIPCYGSASAIAGCTTLNIAVANTDPALEAIRQNCRNAATAPYGGSGTAYGQLAIAALTRQGCYVQGGGILTPAAFGTLGNTNGSTFLGPAYYNLDFSVTKRWAVGERFSAQFRVEFFNVLNHPNLLGEPLSANPIAGPNGGFACSCGTPDGAPDHLNPVLGSGGPRHIQFGLKLGF